MLSHSLVIGYHGCDRKVVERVVAGKADLKPSQNNWDWLGHGIYFWEGSHARALRWAETESLRTESKIKKPGVLGAVIDLGNCLNLTEVEALELVKGAHLAYKQLCVASGVAVPQNRGPELRARYLDCAVIETLHQLRQESHLPRGSRRRERELSSITRIGMIRRSLQTVFTDH